MRKFWMAVAGAVVLAIAVAGIASAVNTYDVHLANSQSAGKGTTAKPSPAKLRFGYRVGDTEGLRPQVIGEYRIAAEGLQSFPDARPKCSFEQAADPNVTTPDDLSPACRRAIVGGGVIQNAVGAPNDRSQQEACEVDLTLINISSGDPRFPSTMGQVRRRGGMAIRIDGTPPRCLTDVHDALAAPFYDVKIQGVSTAELRFKVPSTLTHPSGLDNSVREVTSTVQKKTGRVRIKGKRRTVGFYSSVGRKGRTRTVRVTFIDESGVKKTATAQD